MVLEAESMILEEKALFEEANVGCKTLHARCMKDEDGILDVENVFLDDKDVFLEHEGNSLEAKVIVLSNHVERRKTKEVFLTDETK